tara:strand:- start:1895 stop:3547 length:1653 start_codon:yes stop_codon:yes gene_type:complete
MLKRFDNYDELYSSFRWSIPENYNIASDTIDKFSNSERIALKHVLDDGNCNEFTFKYLQQKSNQLANVLDHLSFKNDDRVGIILGQCPETILSHMACFKSGKISIPLFSLFGDDALLFRLKDSGASTVICDDLSIEKIKRINEFLPCLKNIISINRKKSDATVLSFYELISNASDKYKNVESKSNDPALIIYTSGTTGDPKGALLPHKVLLGHIPGVEMPHEFLTSSHPVTDCFWTPADWAWIGGLFDVLMPALFFGIPVISYRSSKFDPEFTFTLLEKYEVKNTFIPPTALKMMKSFNQNFKGKNLKLRTLGSGGESLGQELLKWGKEIFDVGINEFYGQTECNLTISNCGLIMKQKLGSIGKPVPGHNVRLMNKEGSFINDENEEGEIVVNSSSPSTFLGYWNNKSETEKKIIDGWLHTGDYATLDEDGYFYFKGRKDDLINSSGYRIGPSEIENTILSIDEVEMAAVVGVPDDLRGQIVKAVIVPKNKFYINNQNLELKDKIKNKVKDKLAAHEYPRIIEFVYELPLTTTGKIKRNIIRENHLKENK